MQLKYIADRRTLLWTLVFTPGLVAVQYARPDWVPYLSWLSFYFAVACGVIAHNHLHAGTFRSKSWDSAFGDWLSVFYGYPTFGWIPTHNLNHHRFLNKPGDVTITWRFTNRHTALVALTYFFVSAYYQANPIGAFIRQARSANPALHRRILRQYAVVAGGHTLLLGAGVGLHGAGQGLYVYAFSVGLPALFALWTLMFFNYEQHVHTDPWSAANHSRNFVSAPLNFLLFNNGLHTAHHANAKLHWSCLPEAHAALESGIDEELKQRSFVWYLCKQYLLAPFFPSFGTKQIGRPPFEVPEGSALA